MSVADAVLGRARSQLGTVETGGPHGNDGNVVPYWPADGWPNLQGESWCAAFVTWCFLPFVAAVRYYYCPTGEGWFFWHQALFHDPAQGQAGDVVFYHFAGEPDEANHTGILESVDIGARTVTCIEGNTSPGLAGPQANGGGVYRRTRPWSEVRSLGRPPWPPPAPAPVQPVAPPTEVFVVPTAHEQVIPFPGGQLDAQGRGCLFVPIPSVCLSAMGLSSNPWVEGYWPAAVVTKQPHDNGDIHGTILSFAGAPNQGGAVVVNWLS